MTDAVWEWIDSEQRLVAASGALGAGDVPGLSEAERSLLASAREIAVPRAIERDIRRQIRAGEDPLGDAFCDLRSAAERRPMGATYTPDVIVDSMVAWAAANITPDRVVDPGAGSGRFTIAAGRRFPSARLFAVEVDPVAALMTRAGLSAAQMADRAHVALQDFRTVAGGAPDERTLYIGNPPYVRHHQIDATWKEWLTSTASTLGHRSSQLAGLHVHFFLATATAAREGDIGAFVTSSEWLDVNYGSLVRELLLERLGGTAIHVVEPTALPFADATTTAAITCFEIDRRPASMKLRRVKKVKDLGTLEGGTAVSRERLAEAKRWTPLTRRAPKIPEGFVELGEICRVHRGTVTGGNATWVVRPGEYDLPEDVLIPTVTKARELFEARTVLADGTALKRVVDLPVDLDVFDGDDRKRVDRFLKKAKAAGAADGYVASHRRAWWSVGLRAPAPILATYMARQAPAFVMNAADARHINIAHGLYPREPMPPKALSKLAEALRASVTMAGGRTYAGGLTKFEPREMERILVPDLPVLLA